MSLPWLDTADEKKQTNHSTSLNKLKDRSVEGIFYFILFHCTFLDYPTRKSLLCKRMRSSWFYFSLLELHLFGSFESLERVIDSQISPKVSWQGDPVRKKETESVHPPFLLEREGQIEYTKQEDKLLIFPFSLVSQGTGPRKGGREQV